MATKKSGKTTRIAGMALLGLLVVALIGFGNSNFGGLQRVVATVGNVEISANRYAALLDQERNALSQQVGRNLTIQELRAFGLDSRVLTRLLNAAAIENETQRIGLSVGDEEIAKQIRTRPDFAGLDGRFDQTAYEFALSRIGMSAREFEHALRAEIAGSMIQSAVISGFNAPETFANIITDFLGERRSFSWIALSENDLESPVNEPTDEELRAYYEENTDRFQLPETRDVTYAWLSPETLLEQMEISQDDLLQAYEDRADEFRQPERRLVERLIFADHAAARDALGQIESGEKSFEDIVADRGLSLEDTDLGDVSADDLGGASGAVFALSEPGLAGPVEIGGLGFALFRVNAILSARETPFEDVEEELRVELAGDRARRAIADRITEFEDLLAGGATVEELAAEAGMELGRIDWYSGLDEGIAGYENFNTAAAQTSVEDFPEIVELADGGVFALRVNEVLPPRPEPFADAVARVFDTVILERQTEALKERAAEISAALANGARLSEFGLPTTVETRAERQAFIEGTPETFVRDVFALPEGGVLVADMDGQVFVAQMTAIHATDRTESQIIAIADAVKADAEQSIASDALAAFTRAAQDDAGISFNQTALNAVQAAFQ